MADPFESVVGLLDEEIDLHRRLLGLVKEEQGAIMRGAAADLSDVVGRQEALVVEIRAIEQARRGLIRLVADREGCEPDALPLSELIVRAKPEVAVRLERQREVLSSVLRELADLNEANALLLRDHAAYLRAMVDLVARATAGVTHGKNGCDCHPPSLLVDRTT